MAPVANGSWWCSTPNRPNRIGPPARLVERAGRESKSIGDLTGKRHTKAACALLTHQSMGRYVKELKSGKLRINKAKIAEEEKPDGKYLLSASDDSLTDEEGLLLATSNSWRWTGFSDIKVYLKIKMGCPFLLDHYIAIVRIPSIYNINTLES